MVVASDRCAAVGHWRCFCPPDRVARLVEQRTFRGLDGSPPGLSLFRLSQLRSRRLRLSLPQLVKIRPEESTAEGLPCGVPGDRQRVLGVRGRWGGAELPSHCCPPHRWGGGGAHKAGAFDPVAVGEGGGEFPSDFRHGLRDGRRRSKSIKGGRRRSLDCRSVPQSNRQSAIVNLQSEFPRSQLIAPRAVLKRSNWAPMKAQDTGRGLSGRGEFRVSRGRGRPS